MGSTRKPIDLAIVGGGIAGITLTIGLLRDKNIHVTLYESARAFGEIGAGVSFGPNASNAMSLIDPRIEEGFARRASGNLWESKQGVWFDFRIGQRNKRCEKDGEDGDAGKLITQIRYSKVGAHKRGSVHRAQFLDEMVALLPEGVGRFNKRLVDLEELEEGGVVLKFADGTKASHDAVIGTDGIKSRTRQLMLGENHPAAKAVFTGKCAYRGLVPMDQAVELLGEELATNSHMYMGYHGHLLTFPIQKGETMNVVGFGSKESWDHPEWVHPLPKEDMYNAFSGWGESVTKILSIMKKSDVWALFNHPAAPTYCKGHVCLLGDAAHASTPHQGAGAGMAIEDVYVMINVLSEVNDLADIPKAFMAYDAVRRPRTTKLVATSKDAGMLYDWELPGYMDDLDKIKELMQTRMDWIWQEDLQTEVAQAQAIFRDKIAT